MIESWLPEASDRVETNKPAVQPSLGNWILEETYD